MKVLEDSMKRRIAAAGAVLAAGSALLAVPSRADTFQVTTISATPPDNALAPGCLTGGHADTDVEPTLAADPEHPNNIVATWWTGQTDLVGLAKIGGYAVTHDGGHRWTTDIVRGIDACGGNDKYAVAGGHDNWVAFGPGGRVYMLFESGPHFTDVLCEAVGDIDNCPMSSSGIQDPQETGNTNTQWLIRSDNDGRTWQKPYRVLLPDLVRGPDDQARILVDRHDPNKLYLVWRQMPPSAPLAGDAGIGDAAFYATSNDAGQSWTTPTQIFQPGPASVDLLDPLQLPDGSLVVVFFTVNDSTAPGEVVEPGIAQVPAEVLAARSVDSGKTWAMGHIAFESGGTFLDDPDNSWPSNPSGSGRFFDMQNNPSAAVTPDGNIVVAWGDTTPPGGPGSIFVTTCHPLETALPATANWLTCDPQRAVPDVKSAGTLALAIAGDGTIGLLYEDVRHDHPGDDYWTTEVHLDRSADGGVSWTDMQVGGPYDLSRAPTFLNEGPGGLGSYLGDYIGLVGLPHGFAGDFPVVTTTAPTTNPEDIEFGTWSSN
jgi:hypothetical protein